MRDVGGEWISGTVLGPGKTVEVRPLDPAHEEDIETVRVQWDDPARGSDTVAADALEVLEADEPDQASGDA